MHSTPRLAIQVPDATDLESAFPPVSAQQMGILDNSVRYFSGTISNRATVDSGPIAGDLYYATDTNQWSFYTGAIWSDVGPRSLVTSLPGSPFDGQEIRFQAVAGVVWNLRYNAGSGSIYKWEFIGGPPLFAEVTTSEGTSSASYAALATAGPSITIPTLTSGGDFDVTQGATFQCSLAQTMLMSYDVGGTGAVDVDGVQVSQSSNVGIAATAMRTRRKTGINSATALVSKYKTSAGTPTWSNRFLAVLPVRVG